MASPGIVGRDREREILTSLLEHVEEQGAALVLRGDPGIGKSALLDATADVARERGFRVLGATGYQSEMELPFAGLHQLLRPILAAVDRLPPRQRDALLCAFGMTEEAAPDLFLIALASLDLLAEAAQGSPILVCADDAQWLDRPTSEILSFVARRLSSDRIVLLAAVREGFQSSLSDAGLPALDLTGLGEDASTELLDRSAPDVAADIRERLLLEAEGNPLALGELPSALRSQRLDRAAALPALLPLTARLEQAFAARVSDMPEATRAALLVAAVDDAGALGEVLAAASIVAGVRVSVDALTPAMSARLVEIDDERVRFRHPLVRSALHQAASVAQRQAAHAALASVLIQQPDRRAWHHAAAVVGPDDDAARELEEAADRAQRRGALGIAVTALERAAQLSVDANRRRAALLRACELAFELGQRDQLARLSEMLQSQTLEPAEEARLVWIREMADPRIHNDPVRLHGLVDLADRAEAQGGRDAALNLLWLAAQRSWWRDPGQAERARIVAAAESMASADDDPQVLAIVAYAASIERGAFVVDRLGRWSGEMSPVAAQMLGTAAVTVGAFDLAARFLAASATGLRSEGRLGPLARVLMLQGWSAAYMADWRVAITAADEAGRLGTETGQDLWAGGARLVDALVAAIRGEWELADRHALEAERVVQPITATFMRAGIQLARGLMALGQAKHVDAYEQLRRLFDPGDSAHHAVMRTWAIGDLVEAAVQSGNRDEARAWVQELELLSGESSPPFVRMAMAYARALLADDNSAERLFHAALDAPGDRWPLYRARLELMYGIWLRRKRRVTDSRLPLRSARDAFDALGAVTWSERARQELRASGETSTRRVAASWDQLSPQELQIVQMAADGLSNRDIGQKLFLSHRTVGSHLYRAFPKLGVTSRGQLHGALGPGSPAPA